MSRLKMFNLLFQLTFFRIARILNDDGNQVAWGLLGPVLPFTGWSSDYVGFPVVSLQVRC